MVRFGEPVLDAVFPAAHVEHLGGVMRRRAICISCRVPKPNAVIGETVWIPEGTASIGAVRKADAVTRFAFQQALAKANLLALSMATKRNSFPGAGLDLGDVDMEKAQG